MWRPWCLGRTVVLVAVLFILAPVHEALADDKKTTIVPSPSSFPDKTGANQTGTNRCGTGSNPQSTCQNLYVNSATDFCLWGPPDPASVGDAEQRVVSYCTKSGRGTRLIPQGTLQSVHFLKTKAYVQVSGTADMSKLNVVNNGGGGELDPHGPDGNGNPRGGLVFSNAFGGGLVQVQEWNSFIDSKTYCLRVCKDGPNAWNYCKNIYDELGCEWNMPLPNTGPGTFESCEGEPAQIVGVYTNNGSVSTFQQSQTMAGGQVPPAKPPPQEKTCSPFQPNKLGGSLKNPFAHASSPKMHTSKSLSSSWPRSTGLSTSSTSSTATSSTATTSTSTVSSSTPTSSPPQTTQSESTPSSTSTSSSPRLEFNGALAQAPHGSFLFLATTAFAAGVVALGSLM